MPSAGRPARNRRLRLGGGGLLCIFPLVPDVTSGPWPLMRGRPQCPQVLGEGDGRAVGASRERQGHLPGAEMLGGEGPAPQGRLGRGGRARLGVLTGRGSSGFGAEGPVPISATPPGGPCAPGGGRAILDDGSQRLPYGSGCGAALGLNRSPGAPIDGGPCAARAACDE